MSTIGNACDNIGEKALRFSYLVEKGSMVVLQTTVMIAALKFPLEGVGAVYESLTGNTCLTQNVEWIGSFMGTSGLYGLGLYIFTLSAFTLIGATVSKCALSLILHRTITWENYRFMPI